MRDVRPCARSPRARVATRRVRQRDSLDPGAPPRNAREMPARCPQDKKYPSIGPLPSRVPRDRESKNADAQCPKVRVGDLSLSLVVPTKGQEREREQAYQSSSIPRGSWSDREWMVSCTKTNEDLASHVRALSDRSPTRVSQALWNCRPNAAVFHPARSRGDRSGARRAAAAGSRPPPPTDAPETSLRLS